MPLQYRSEALLHSLATLHRQAPAVLGSAVFTQDGLLIAAYPPGWDGDIHDPTGGEHVAAMAAVVAGTAERTMDRLAQGGVERVMIEGEKGTVAIFPVTSDAALALLIDKQAKLGLTLQAARQTTEQVRAILDKTM